MKEWLPMSMRIKILRNESRSAFLGGVDYFFSSLGRFIRVLLHFVSWLVSKIALVGIVLFGVMTIVNLFKMGFTADVLHTKSFFLFAVSFGTGFISAIIAVFTAE